MSEPGHWAEPGTHRVLPGVYRIPLPVPDKALRAVNVYALTGPSGVALIDGGWADPACEAALAEGLARVGRGLADITDIYVTHNHLDHYSLALKLRADHGCRVALGSGERHSLDVGARDEAPLAQTDQLRRGGDGARAEEFARRLRASELPAWLQWAEPDRWLSDGDQLEAHGRVLEVVATPGHTRGHVCFAVPGALFTGDHVLPHITPSIGFERAPDPLAVLRYLESLEAVLARPDARMLPAHGAPGPSTRARAAELIDHHRERLASSLDGVRAGARTALDVAEGWTWTRGDLGLHQLEVVHRGLAVIEVASHLDMLTARGDLSAEEIGGIRRYTIASPTAEGQPT